MGVIQPLFAVQVTLAVVCAPASSMSASGNVLTAPAALFQFAAGTTPALSAASIRTVFVPMNLIPIVDGATGGVAAGTIWMPFTGARRVAVVAAVGVAVKVKPVAEMVNRT